MADTPRTLPFPFFAPHPRLVAALSRRADGDCRLMADVAPAHAEAAHRNRAAFLRRLGIAPEDAVSAGLVHGAHVHHATAADAGRIIAGTDALVACARDGVALSLTVADCLPIFLFDPVADAYGIAHAGWRGLAGGVIPATVRAMSASCGASAAHMIAVIGPGIGPCHFEVKHDVAAKFAGHPGAVIGGARTYVDLPLVARDELRAAGIPDTHIETSAACTFDGVDEYFSRRREPEPKEAMMAVIGLRGA